MADDNRNNDDDKNVKKGGEFRMQPRTWVVWAVIIGGIVLLATMKDKYGDVQRTPLTQYEFLQKAHSNLIANPARCMDSVFKPVGRITRTR
jgi:hypothetical protein